MKFNHKQFSYGIELEGAYNKKFLTQLRKGKKARMTTDGSVDIDHIIYGNGLDKSEFSSRYQELRLGVFKSRTALLKTLAKIKKPYYYSDHSCGLHLHIGIDEEPRELREVITQFSFIKQLQHFSYTELCSHVKERKNNTYCKPYKNKDELAREFFQDYDSKYHFVRNHPQGTLEFRFFSACEHKVDNINKFLNKFFTDLTKANIKKKSIFLLRDNEPTLINKRYIMFDNQDFIRREYRLEPQNSLNANMRAIGRNREILGRWETRGLDNDTIQAFRVALDFDADRIISEDE